MAADPQRDRHLTRRERILRAVCVLFETMREGQPEGDPYTTTWGVITRTPLDGVHVGQKRHALAILDPAEFKAPRISQMVSTLTLITEFRVFLGRDEDGSEEANRVMGDIQRRMRENVNLAQVVPGGLTENIVELANEVDVDGIVDRHVRGAVTWNVLYKHSVSDPRLQVPGKGEDLGKS